MLNYVKSELYRMLHSRGYLIFYGVCAIVLILINLLFRGGSPIGDLGISMYLISQFLSIVGLLTICIADMVFSSGYKHQTLKNTLAYGCSRSQLFFGKFLTEVIVAFAVAGVVFGLFLGSGFLFLGNSPEIAVIVNNFMLALLGCIPIWLGCLALAHLCLFLIRGDVAAGIAFAGLLVLPNTVLAFLGMLNGLREICITAREYLLWNQYSNLLTAWHLQGEAIELSDLALPAVIGLAHMAVFLLIGLLLFKKKEI